MFKDRVRTALLWWVNLEMWGPAASKRRVWLPVLGACLCGAIAGILNAHFLFVYLAVFLYVPLVIPVRFGPFAYIGEIYGDTRK